MKRLSFLLSAAALLLAGALTSCSNSDNIVIPATPAEETVDGGLIIMEINVGGNKDANNKNYNWCKAITLYNNSSKTITAKNLGIAFTAPMNAHAGNKNYGEDGVLVYEKEGYVPALQGVWYFPQAVTVAPFTDVVIAVNGAIDHTANGAFDLSGADYAMYDTISAYKNVNAYPAPTSVPESNWLKAVSYTTANTWPVSMICPALFIFQAPEGTDLVAYLNDEANLVYTNGDTKQSAANKSAKIPMEWIIDGVELFPTASVKNAENSQKRLPASIDAGNGVYNSFCGYSAYRNVDTEATEKLTANDGKLVYGYADEVEGTTADSDIDAAASLKNGAKIVYKDSNNSSADFHLRKGWSLK